MKLKVAFMLSESQLNLKTLDYTSQTIDSKIIDSVTLKEQDLGLLLLDGENNLESFNQILTEETKFYPIIDASTVSLNKDDFEKLNFDTLAALYTKVSSRWILNNNIKTIEQIYPTVSYLRDLWIKDRNSFFEELWFLLKTNLATTDLSIIFHDLKEPTEKQKEKGEKPSLCYSYVQGEKIPNLFEGKDKEQVLMKEYEKDFQETFNITEYNAQKGQIVACSKINLSPILIMGKLPNFNQLQQSILIALFTGLQDT